MDEVVKKYEHILEVAHEQKRQARMLRGKGKETLARIIEGEARLQVQKAETEISAWRMKNASNK